MSLLKIKLFLTILNYKRLSIMESKMAFLDLLHSEDLLVNKT